METLERLLCAHPFLAELSPEHLRSFAGCVANLRFAPGEFLFREGDRHGRLYLIRHGTVAIESASPGGAPITLETVGPGDVLGVSWLAKGLVHFDCRARDTVLAFVIDEDCLVPKMDADPALGYALASRLLALTYERLARVRMQRLDLYPMTAAAENAFATAPLAIARVTTEIDDVFTWVMEPSAPWRFMPGQFNMLYVHGVGEVPISISGNAREPARLVHTIRAVGGVTRAMQRLGAGDTVFARGPYGTPWPLDEARGRDVLFVAGGLGLAPLRPAILEVLARRADHRRVTIAVGARAPEQILFSEEVAGWRSRFDVEVEVTVDRAGRDWHGPVGVVTRLVAEAALDARQTTAFVCGPEVMMRFVARELEQRGVAMSNVWLSLERSMKCGVGLCGHCQLGGHFVCKDGPVYRADRILPSLYVREL